MAGDWIKMRANLDTHPKVVTLASTLDTSELHVIGMLWKVWTWADQHSLDGNAVSVTESFLDRMTSATGFAVALRKVGWLDGRDGSLSFPRFAEHNGQTAKTREETNARVARHRATKKRECNGESVTKTVTREEKRREEKIETSTCLGSGALKTGKDWGGSVFKNLLGEHLPINEILDDWLRFATDPQRAKQPLFINSGGYSENNRLQVFAAAERAIEEGKPPLKLFRFIVGKSKWELISQAQEDRARARLLSMRRQSNGTH